MKLDKEEAKVATGEKPGKVNDRGEWSPDTSYKRGDRVTRGGEKYILSAFASLNQDPAASLGIWRPG